MYLIDIGKLVQTLTHKTKGSWINLTKENYNSETTRLRTSRSVSNTKADFHASSSREVAVVVGVSLLLF